MQQPPYTPFFKLQRLARAWQDADDELKAARETQSRAYYLKSQADSLVNEIQDRQRAIELRIVELLTQ